MHGHGGVVLEHLKAIALQSDIGPDDTFFWYTSPSWMMWNFQVAGLLVGATIVCYDGSPSVSAAGRVVGHRRPRRRDGLRHQSRLSARVRQGAGACRARIMTCRRFARSASRGHHCRRRRRCGCATTSANRSKSRRSAAAPMWCRRSSAVSARCRYGRASCQRRIWASHWMRGMSRVSRCAARSGSWSSRSRCRRCRSNSGTMRTEHDTAQHISRCFRKCGGTVTGSRSPSTAASWCTAGRTRH